MKTKSLLVAILVLALLATTAGLDGILIEAQAALPSLAATLYITINEGVESISINKGSSYNSSTAIVYTSSSSMSALGGMTYYWAATPKSGYTMNQSSGTITPTAGLYNELAPSATKSTTMYTLTVTINTGVARVVLTYGDGTNRSVSTTTTLSIESGTSVSWTATAAAGYNLSSSSGSFIMTSAKTIAPTATVKSFTVSVSSYSPSDAYLALSWTLEWAEGEELTGDPTDYVMMTVASDSMSVTLTFKKAFTAGTMILTCYATNNPSVSATCTITCG